ncbi:MAG: FG-GAP repeat domain-containing protein, partial [Actinomycetota bacterium]
MRALGFVALAVTLAAGNGCRSKGDSPAAPPPLLSFTRVTESAGIRFRHDDGSSGRKYFPEVMGPGCAFADFNADGSPDVLLLNGARLPGTPPRGPFGSKLYVNRGDGAFDESPGFADDGYAMGCCAGDYDNDGRTDLYVTHLGENILYHNEGNGRFSVAKRAGVSAKGFSTGAAFADYDGDGWLDLYVCRYVDWSPQKNVVCTDFEAQKPVRVYCRPIVFPPAPGILYRNNRDGTFTDVTAQAGMTPPPGRSLGCVWTDVNDDGAPDLYVANDMSNNFLFINDGKGRFREEALARGVAVGENGRAQASMGVCAVDYDRDGRMDLACTNFSGEYLALYRNLGGGTFEDVSARTGLVEATAPYVGFGVGFPDLDLDGAADLFVANGHVTEAAERFYPGVQFAQPKLWLLGGSAVFRPTTNLTPAMAEPRVGRGAAFADLEGDGDLDA